MQFVIIGLWMICTSIVGHESAKDLKQEYQDHKSAPLKQGQGIPSQAYMRKMVEILKTQKAVTK